MLHKRKKSDYRKLAAAQRVQCELKRAQLRRHNLSGSTRVPSKAPQRLWRQIAVIVPVHLSSKYFSIRRYE